MSPKRPQDKSAEEKLKIVIEAETVAEDQLGAFLRGKSGDIIRISEGKEGHS